ncbi:alpha/beta-hydrolase [Eremomyces bilateralis CBS 781.70]|uniref:Alpha/beta-hydrolase n=1 Tax=Eremomyces bilateralis CBS 781.70 TaxID=1392243 RepID=A0A6G1GA01_9PEZI|nr:alpha/beta-hydrolase [Eremomyces bilateralis CBS 781.70]KAF1814740.1 alpha/beta-hydrolase [Eremomyces bilateralis CBS 781.70]
MPYINRSGVSLYYATYGSGTPLLLSHGFSATSEMWSGQIALLSARFKLILWDMRGHGKSDYPEDPAMYSEQHTVADMEAILAEVCGTKRAIVGGLSLGGYMSLAFYLAHPERVKALLIIDTGPGFKNDAARDGWNKYALQTAERFEQHGLRRLEKMSVEMKTSTHRDAKGLALAGRGMLIQKSPAVIKSLPNIKVPSLVVVGANDTPFLAGSDYMSRTIPGCKTLVIADAGHAANIDQPQAFNVGLLNFLANIEPARGSL